LSLHFTLLYFISIPQEPSYGVKSNTLYLDSKNLLRKYTYEVPQLYEMGGPCSTNGEKSNAYRLLVGKPEGKRPLGRPRRRWIILEWILERWDGVMWTGLVWLRIGTGGELL
jgi:hypothetical protein